MKQKFSDENYSNTVTQAAPIETPYDEVVGLPKTFTVPEGEIWEICWAHVKLISSATVGNRNLLVIIKNADGDEVFDFTTAVTQAASLTRHYTFQQGVYRESAFSADDIQLPIPKDFFLTPGFTVTISDANDIDAAGDQTKVSFQYKRLKGCQ